MTYFSNISLKALAAGIALAISPLGYSQIPEQDLESIFARLNGDDFPARYEARMELHTAVSRAGAPGSEAQQASKLEIQLLELLQREALPTTHLWVLRQLQFIGSQAALPVLEGMAASGNEHLHDGVEMTIAALAGASNAQTPPALSDKPSELAALLDGPGNRSLKTAAYAKLAEKSPRLAAKELDGTPLPEYLRIAATSKHSSLRNAAFQLISDADIPAQIVLIGALQGRVSAKREMQLISLLSSENETLKLQALEALSRVGSARSADAVLALIEGSSRELKAAAIDALASIQDPRLDQSLRKTATSGKTQDRIQALEAMSYRVSPGISNLVNSMATDSALPLELREQAIASMERVGNVQSLSILVTIVLEEAQSGLRRDAQGMLKRLSLRLDDAAAAWAAFDTGFEASRDDLDTRLALMLVADSSPSPEMIDYLTKAYDSGDENIQKMVLRVLPSWRNWDGGYALMDILEKVGSSKPLRLLVFKGIGRLILGSDETFPLEEKYELTSAALVAASTEEERKAILDGFRFVSNEDKRYVRDNAIDPELTEIVLNGTDNR